MAKTRFIINPRSGASARARPLVEHFASKHGAGVVLTERARHAAELARRALDDGSELVVAVGGDGTMNEVAGVVAGTGATLGLIPCGSGDGLGRHLRIHGSVPRALAILHEGEARVIDSGLADGHPFFTVAGLGFEAEIASLFNRLHRRGFVRYLATILKALRTSEPEDITITSPGGTSTVRAFTLAIANCAQYGNGARIAPSARVDDGLLDLTAVPPVSWRNLPPLAWRIFGGTLPRAAGVVCRQAPRFVVERKSPGLLHTDGEVHEAGFRVEFVVRPASLRVMCPADT